MTELAPHGTATIPAATRREFLRGAGVVFALPALHSLGRGALGKEQAGAKPKRLAFIYAPNGVNIPQWNVRGVGKDYQLSPTLKPLASFKNDFTVISGLNHEEASPGDDGAGDHARAAATYLTGCRAKKTAGADIHLGVSVDQIAAQQIGRHTRLPSLELSTDRQRSSGRCDSGYSCAYQYNLSWKTAKMPLAAEMDPRLVFERLFGAELIVGPNVKKNARRDLQKSVLDFILDDARSLRGRLNAADNHKLDQYLEAVRTVERRIQGAEKKTVALPDAIKPTGVPDSFGEHIRIMFDLLVLCFQTDSTRITTFMLSHDGSNHSFPEIGIPEAHHQLSHHRDDKAKLEKIARIDRFYTEQFAYLLDRLKKTKEGENSLLDQCMIVYGSGISDGNKHWHNNLPILLAGRGGGSLNPGKHLKAPDPTPMTNLYMALLQRMGVSVEQVGDSTGVLKGV